MKVYVLFSGHYSDTTLHGIYSTREKAQEQIDRAIREAGPAREDESRFHFYCELADPDSSSGPRIEEWTLDDEAYQFWTTERKWAEKK